MTVKEIYEGIDRSAFEIKTRKINDIKSEIDSKYFIDEKIKCLVENAKSYGYLYCPSVYIYKKVWEDNIWNNDIENIKEYQLGALIAVFPDGVIQLYGIYGYVNIVKNLEQAI